MDVSLASWFVILLALFGANLPFFNERLFAVIPTRRTAKSVWCRLLELLVLYIIVGLIARAIMPGDQNMGIIMTTILGIVGAVVAGFLGRSMGWYADGEPVGWIASVVGAIIVLFVVGLATKKKA